MAYFICAYLIVYTGSISDLNVQVTELIAYNHDVINNEY